MTEIEKQALAHINTVRTEFGLDPILRLNRADYVTHEVVCRIVQQFEQRKRDVSDKIEQAFLLDLHDTENAFEPLRSLILPKPRPDPLVEALKEALKPNLLPENNRYADSLRAALVTRGLKIVEAE